MLLYMSMQGYRSGHNEAVLKTVWGNPRGFESHTLRHFGGEIHISAPFLFAFLHVLWDTRTTFVIFVFKLFFTLLKTAAFPARKLREGLWF